MKKNTYDYLLFTSTNAVRYFFEYCKKYCHDFSVLSDLSIIAIGEKTKSAVEKYKFDVTFIPSHYDSESLAEQLQQMPIEGKRFLFPHGQLAKKTLKKELEKKSANVDAFVVYQTTAPQNHPLRKKIIGCFEQSRIDVITFTSPSTVQNFVALIGKERVKRYVLNEVKIAVIGPTTKRETEKLNIPAHIVGKQSSLSSLTGAIVDYYEKRLVSQSV